MELIPGGMIMNSSDCQIIIYLDDRPIASYPSELSGAIGGGVAVKTLKHYASMFPGRPVRCAVRTEDGHVLVGPDGILLDSEVTT